MSDRDRAKNYHRTEPSDETVAKVKVSTLGGGEQEFYLEPGENFSWGHDDPSSVEVVAYEPGGAEE